MNAIINGVVFINDTAQYNKVIIFNEKIDNIVSYDEFLEIKNNIDRVYDANGSYVLAGFIEQHIHGYNGYDVMDNNENAIIEISNSLVQNGVTSFLPTTLTASKVELQKVCDIVRKAKEEQISGAKIVGVHLEGPYINIEKRGAQNEKYIVKPDVDFVSKNVDILKILTIAPETHGALELIEKFKDKINFQIGHTNGTYEETKKGIKHGAKGFTHLFNAMSGIHHRDIGAVGCCLNDDDVYAEIICDNIHITKELYSFIIKNKGIDKLLLVTDCMRAGGVSEGEYDLGGLKTIVKNNECRLENGSLAGSVLKINEAIKNVVENTNCDFWQCIKMVSENQAKYLGLDDVGKLEKGYCSDIVIMNKNYIIEKTFVNGRCEFEK